MKNCTIKEFCKYLGKVYNGLYEGTLKIDGYREKAEAFDRNIKQFDKILKAYVEYEADFISSDREAVAFMITFEHFSNNGYDKIVGHEIPGLIG